jgi:hypothetical protein
VNLFVWQTIYVLGGIVILPFAPFLYLQGKYVRRKIGRLPDASGETSGKFGVGNINQRRSFWSSANQLPPASARERTKARSPGNSPVF